MLGRPYAICRNVVEGDQMGRELGFPTANLDVTGLVLPPNGVYAGLSETSWERPWYRTALNVGFRPTVGSGSQLTFMWRHICLISAEIFTVKNWRWKSETSCVKNENLHLQPICVSKLPRDIAAVCERVN